MFHVLFRKGHILLKINQNHTKNMGLMNTLRKFCVMKSVREKAKEESEDEKKD
jgi:hypothetical protein